MRPFGSGVDARTARVRDVPLRPSPYSGAAHGGGCAAAVRPRWTCRAQPRSRQGCRFVPPRSTVRPCATRLRKACTGAVDVQDGRHACSVSLRLAREMTGAHRVTVGSATACPETAPHDIDGGSPGPPQQATTTSRRDDARCAALARVQILAIPLQT